MTHSVEVCPLWVFSEYSSRLCWKQRLTTWQLCNCTRISALFATNDFTSIISMDTTHSGFTFYSADLYNVEVCPLWVFSEYSSRLCWKQRLMKTCRKDCGQLHSWFSSRVVSLWPYCKILLTSLALSFNSYKVVCGPFSSLPLSTPSTGVRHGVNYYTHQFIDI